MCAVCACACVCVCVCVCVSVNDIIILFFSLGGGHAQARLDPCVWCPLNRSASIRGMWSS